MKPLDDIEAQQQYWNEKFTEELNLRLLLKQPIDVDFVRTIMSLDDQSSIKQQMTTILQKIQRQMTSESLRNAELNEKLSMKQVKE